MTDQQRHAALRLALAVEPGTAGIAARVAEFGPAATVEMLVAGRDRRGAAMRSRLARADPDAAQEQVASIGGRVILPGDIEYPSQLCELDEPPLALWVRGPLDIRLAALRSVAVVGARAATGYGDRVAHDLAHDLAGMGWTVVSGAAYGIDAAAHRGALAASGSTVAILACGVDRVYPRAHDQLVAMICDEGAVVSELPPGSEPLRFRFLTRNRVIAALTRATVVVEAAARSGAVATAHRAAELGRPLMAVPGPVTSMASAGTNRLLHEQFARAVSDAEEVVAVVTGQEPAQARPPGGPEHRFPAHRDHQAADGPGTGLSAPPAAPPAVLPADLPEGVREVLAVLGPRAGMPVDDVAHAAGVPAGAALSALGLLELWGLAARGEAGWFALSSARAP